jgi:pyridoxamine 5'-phosphate oxidase
MSVTATLRALLTLGRGALKGISELTADPDPIAMFERWFDDAMRAGIFLPESVALATASTEGRPSARMMLLKGVDRRGFVFYSNYESRKAAELEANPRAAIIAHWSILERQVRVEGTVQKVPKEETEAYWGSRPRGSRIGAWASRQSTPLESREALELAVTETARKYKGREVPLPPYWGGYRLVPEVIEFWQGRANRLHDRLRYERDGDGWKITRLSP